MQRSFLITMGLTAVLGSAVGHAGLPSASAQNVRNENLKLLPSDGKEGAWFGYSIGIDNGVVAVGARADYDNGYRSGSAYLFDASTGAQIAKLLPSDGEADDQFGISVAIDTDIVAVGAYIR